MAEPRSRDGNPGRLKDLIDRGDAASKVGAPDPGAANLGTDEEAAGARPETAQVRRSVRQEGGRNPGDPWHERRRLGPSDAVPGAEPQLWRRRTQAVLLVSVAGFLVLVVAALLLVSG